MEPSNSSTSILSDRRSARRASATIVGPHRRDGDFVFRVPLPPMTWVASFLHSGMMLLPLQLACQSFLGEGFVGQCVAENFVGEIDEFLAVEGFESEAVIEHDRTVGGDMGVDVAGTRVDVSQHVQVLA